MDDSQLTADFSDDEDSEDLDEDEDSDEEAEEEEEDSDAEDESLEEEEEDSEEDEEMEGISSIYNIYFFVHMTVQKFRSTICFFFYKLMSVLENIYVETRDILDKITD